MTTIRNLPISSIQKSYHKNDINERSITPRTHIERDFNSSLLPTNNNNDYYIDLYQHIVREEVPLEAIQWFYEYYLGIKDNIKNEVLRFGINHYQDNLKTTLDTHNNSNAKKLVVVEEQSNLSKSSKGTSPTTTMQDLKNAGQLTDIEKNLATTAISYLNSNPNNITALLDIFARDPKTGQIKFEQKLTSSTSTITIDVPEIHTVVLYKQKSSSGQNDFLVIDPSNAMFSHVLAEVDDHIRLCLNKKCQIYVKANGGETGYGMDKWRDCVDIAVKLSFNLNIQVKLGKTINLEAIDQSSNLYKIAFNSLKQSFALNAISNQSSIIGKLPKQVEDYNMRLNQSSDIKIANKFTAILKTINIMNKKILDYLKPDVLNFELTLKNTETIFDEALKKINKAQELDTVLEVLDTFNQDTALIGDDILRCMTMENNIIDQLL